MNQTEKNLSNLSYTNKDFGQIYPELLDLAKTISYKWDPTQSDESDPGVVLLKLAALMADKNNYNIDKNILELFPLSVTQLQNARQIFDQCGYTMRYYQSATTELSMTLVKEPELDDEAKNILYGNIDNVDLTDPQYTRKYVIPKFTMVSDAENKIIYTITEDAVLESTGIAKTNIQAIQGVINDYTINGESLITVANLDHNNRLYFQESDIAENGIFIEGSLSKSYWKRVDNLLLQPLGEFCFKFGVSKDSSSCYIEFPNDADSIFADGIKIKYIRTRGTEGNIGRNRLKQFYVDVTVDRYWMEGLAHQGNISLTTYENSKQGNVYITNQFPVTNGRNPETIDEAYRNYQRVKNTFETLVSCKDYENFFYTNKNVSNCVVCDRTNDLQSSYKILESTDGGNILHTCVQTKNSTGSITYKEEGSDTIQTVDDANIVTDELNAFDLRVYGFKYVENPKTDKGFAETFEFIDDIASTELRYDSEDIKSIQHNFAEFEENRPILFFNKFPIVSRIIPIHKLNAYQEAEVKTNVIAALYSKLNSRALEFGTEVSYEDIYETILSADTRIRAITLKDISYSTWAMYRDNSGVIREECVDSTGQKEGEPISIRDEFKQDIYAKAVLAGVTPLYTRADNYNYNVNHTESAVYDKIKLVTTNADINFTADDKKYTSQQLTDNENVVFYAPTLIEDKPYSSYVKFIHNIGIGTTTRPILDQDKSVVVSQNANYALADNEYIIFFWKSTDSDDAPYEYMKYDWNSSIKIISPSFSMRKQGNPEFENIPDPYFSSIKSGRGQINSGDDCYTFVSNLSGSEYVLTGSNTITTKKSNTVTITDTTRKVFWILNSSNKTLFKENETEYTLKSGEYFIYTNEAQTQLVMLEAGTIIKRSHDTSAWTHGGEAVSYDEFISEGVDYLNQNHLWYKVPEGAELTATETEYCQLGPGYSIILTDRRTNATTPYENLVIKNDGIYHGTDYLEKIISLKDFTISYVDTDSNTQTLPSRNDPDLAWNCYSILNINSSPTKSQKLLPTHKICCKELKGDGSTNELITLEDCYINTSRAVDITGGINVDVTYYDVFSDITSDLEIYSYKTLDESSSLELLNQIWNWDFTEKNPVISMEAYFDDGSASYTYTGIAKLEDIKLLSGTYILPIKNAYDFDTLELIISNADILNLRGKDLNYSNSGKHYFKIDVTEDVTTTITLNYQLSTNQLKNKITFYPMIKINTETDNGSITIEDVVDRINELDKKHYYDFTYQVPDEVLISDPLDSFEFLNPNHPCNKFTICKWDTSKDVTSIIVSTNVR